MKRRNPWKKKQKEGKEGAREAEEVEIAMQDATEQHNGKASLANDRGVIVPSQCKVIHLEFSRRHQSYRSIEISPPPDEYSSFIRKTWPMNMRDAADLIKLPYRVTYPCRRFSL